MIPDPESSNFILGLIGAGAALVLFFYGVNIWLLPTLRNLFGKGSFPTEERVHDLLNTYHENNRKLESSPRDISMTSPRLQMLKAANREEEILCLLVNRGGTASNLQIEPFGAHSASIQPAQSLQNGQTGSVSLRNVDSDLENLQFQLSYEDPIGIRVIRKYQYSSRDNNFIEV